MNDTAHPCPALLHRSSRGASAASLLRLSAAAATIAILLGGCARPVGDFGRAAPSFTHDVAMPTVGDWRAKAAGEPVSDFNWTDQEEEMHNRVWRFLVAPHAHDWFYDTAVELQRTRITSAQDHRFDEDRYYKWLSRTRYESSRVRFSTITSDVEADLDTLPGTFASICAVLEVDRQRRIAGDALYGHDPAVGEDVLARRAENDMQIGWFVRALRYRHDSYAFALERLLVETPHEEAQLTDARLAELGAWVALAEARDFCRGGHHGGHRPGEEALPSRVLLSDKEPIYRK